MPIVTRLPRTAARLPMSRRASVAMTMSVTLAAAAGAPLGGALGAQQQVRIEMHRAPRPMLDGVEKQLRQLQRQLDSLGSIYNENDELTAAERRRVGDELNRTAELLGDLSTRLQPRGEDGGSASVRFALPPMSSMRATAAMARALTHMREAQGAIPRGWMGFVAEGARSEPRFEGGEMIIRYLSYPRIVTVDPSSPAQRAGLVPSDTLIAYDGRDVRENDISLTRLLRPSAVVSVRVRRDGRVRDVPVTVAPVPNRIIQRRDDENREVHVGWVTSGVPDAPAFPGTPVPPGTFSPLIRSRVYVARPVTPTLAPPAPPTLAFGFSFNGVAGAQLATITEGLGRTLGVRYGVLVTNAPVGSPASESGLQDGDVIVKVGGQVVHTVPEVREIVAMVVENGDHGVELETVREKRTRKVMLKW